ncbi:DUF4864 domain-containing protein [Pacificoceanicola onchidii]|uniref:DUF4864 domain-containing protein n=1 Tax=Pacificoceanicola onchidii TaxID=2562685 RepID=UPI0010A63B0A|nr:DUF4864 domain-containing protein [Pacificoceanicola onchidii]
MRGRLFAIILAVLWSGSLWAQEALPPNPKIQDVIEGQVEAFLADDFGTAFTFAGPSIQRMFRDPETFGSMVRNGYPMVHRPSDLMFGELREISGLLWQKVIVVDGAGQTHVLDYRMGEYEDGWRIDAVQILPTPGVSA